MGRLFWSGSMRSQDPADLNGSTNEHSSAIVSPAGPSPATSDCLSWSQLQINGFKNRKSRSPKETSLKNEIWLEPSSRSDHPADATNTRNEGDSWNTNMSPADSHADCLCSALVLHPMKPLKKNPCWFGHCSYWRISTGNSSTFNICYVYPWQQKVVTRWSSIIENSKEKLTILRWVSETSRMQRKR